MNLYNSVLQFRHCVKMMRILTVYAFLPCAAHPFGPRKLLHELARAFFLSGGIPHAKTR